MELSTSNILSLFETNKEQRQTFVNQVIEQLDSGNIDVLKLKLQIKSMQDICENIEANPLYKECISECEQKHGKAFTLFNAKFQFAEAGVKYDYSQTNDPVYFELKAKAEKAANDLKEREKFLKSVPATGQQIIQDGEVLTIYPPSKSSTTILKTTLL